MKNRILLVDDELDITSLAKERLIRQGYEVFTANNGQEALNITLAEKPDVIVSDVVMPVMDGFAFFKEVKNNHATQHIPFIILTGRTNMEESFRVLGAAEFLSKPFTMQGLQEKIEFVLKRASGKFIPVSAVILSERDKQSEEMALEMERGGCLAQVAYGPVDFFTKVLNTKPRVVLLDILLDDIHATEIIRALRCFTCLHQLKILTFTYFEPERLGSVDAIEQLREAKDSCTAAGATKYIGRYTRVSLMDQIRAFLK